MKPEFERCVCCGKKLKIEFKPKTYGFVCDDCFKKGEISMSKFKRELESEK